MTTELHLLLRVKIGSYTTALHICLHGVHREKFRLLTLTECIYWYCLAITEARSRAKSSPLDSLKRIGL
jgi:hypothetical protein